MRREPLPEGPSSSRKSPSSRRRLCRGLVPVLAIEQSTARTAGPRSTVATATEIADYARLLWATAGRPHCPDDGSPVSRRTLDDCVAQIMSEGEGKRAIVLSP